MMKRTLILCLTLLAFCCVLRAQEGNTLTSDQSAMLQQIVKSSRNMNTLQCRLRQEKTSQLLSEPQVATGKMAFKQPDNLRWEYVEPTPFVFVMHGGEMKSRTSDGKVSTLSAGSSGLGSLTSMIVSLITGKSLADERTFGISIVPNGTVWNVRLTPKDRRMKKMFKAIELNFDSNANVMKSIRMTEASDEVTSITFSDLSVGKEIDEKEFVL